MDKSNGQVARHSRALTSAQRGAATRRAILAAAAQLIAETGWCAVTTRAIAARAGVPHGAVSYHFAGRADLLREAALEATRASLAEPLALVGRAGSVSEVLQGTFAWYAAGGLSDPSVALLLETAREAGRDEALRAPIAVQLREYRAALADLVRRDQERGAVVPGVTAEGAAALLAALLDGLILHLVLDPELDTRPVATSVLGLLGGDTR